MLWRLKLCYCKIHTEHSDTVTERMIYWGVNKNWVKNLCYGSYCKWFLYSKIHLIQLFRATQCRGLHLNSNDEQGVWCEGVLSSVDYE